MKKIFLTVLLLLSTLSLTGCFGDSKYPEVTNVRLSEQTLKWDIPLHYALLVKYEIKISGQTTERHVVDGTELGLSTTVTTSGTYNFAITTFSRSDESRPSSDAVVVSYDLEVAPIPLNLRYSDQTKTLSWNHTSAGRYEVNVNNKTAKTTENVHVIEVTKGTVTTKVRSLGDGDRVFDSPFSRDYVFTYLTTPKNVRQEGQSIIWEAVSGANGYKLLNNGQDFVTVPATQTSYRLSTSESNLVISVMALGNGLTTFDSDISEAVTVIPSL